MSILTNPRSRNFYIAILNAAWFCLLFFDRLTTLPLTENPTGRIHQVFTPCPYRGEEAFLYESCKEVFPVCSWVSLRSQLNRQSNLRKTLISTIGNQCISCS